MTTITHIRGINMRYALAAGRRAVVTIKAIAAESRMVDDRYRKPRTDVMTGIAFGRGLDMPSVLACRRDAVVAT